MRRIYLCLLLGMALLTGSSASSAQSPAIAQAPPLFDGLGGLSRKVTTTTPEAQRYFDQGLAFVYAFNHDEAIRAFSHAAKLDPSCAMAHWGVAYANGPHINNPVVPPERAAAAWKATGLAMAAASEGTPVERALIDALVRRYADPQPEDRKPLDQAYADAMRKVWEANPKDADVGALFAEALADLRPWDLWMADGKPQPGTEELVATLEAVIALDPKHPLANHLMIHAVEASPNPEKADRAADTLRDLQPGLGHLVHMPSHIDVRRGRWQQAIAANDKAMKADASYAAKAAEQGFYRLYMSHNHHMLTYGAMMTGQSVLAMKTIRKMVSDIPLEFFRQNPWADGFMAMPLEVMMRFGKWNDILAEPAFPDFVPISRALQHYARAVAYAAKDDVESARREQTAFREARAKVPAEATFGNNSGSDILDVAEQVMNGEILFRSGKIDEGIAALREGAKREDALRYDEPPDWIQPVRHPLGAALLQAGRFAEAEAVFREDLARLPDNGWALYGLGRALRLQKKNKEAAAVEAEFKRVWKDGDVKLKSACLCLPGV
ncbi:MAG: tetratricopeptide repeat protein [Thermoanaerobaculia bacterium]|nr:tetratricopeptide repeat protein [Thermoanaerobaculia bacterium]